MTLTYLNRAQFLFTSHDDCDGLPVKTLKLASANIMIDFQLTLTLLPLTLTLVFKQMQQIFSHSKARKYVKIIMSLPDKFDSKNVQ